MATTQAFCLKRNNHLNDMVDDLEMMLKDENMVDVTLSCDDGLIKAHKIILSACSSYFRHILSKGLNNSLQYPIIIIKDMLFQDLKAIIDFIYRGEVTVPQEQLNSVLKSAEFLKIKGLADVTGQKGVNLTTSSSTVGTIGKNTLVDENLSKRKKKKKKRKSNYQTSDKEKQNSSGNCTEYSDEEDILTHLNLNSQTNQSQNESSHNNLLQASAHHANSSMSALNLNENEIEPSRLLEQTMITGDAPNVSNIQSLSQANNQNKYSQYLISNVKQIMYDDSSGLITGNAEQSSNHNLTFDEHSNILANTIAGSSSISLLPRQNQGLSPTLTTNSSFISDNRLSPMNALIPLDATQQQSNNFSGGEELTVHQDANNKPKSSYQCTLCFKRFDIRYSLQRHMKVIHDPSRHLFQCNACNKEFAWKSAYLRHINHTCARQRR